MRIRHAGIMNKFMRSTWTQSSETPIEEPGAMTRAAMMLWLWRVKEWKWRGAISWNGGDDSLAFDDLLMAIDGSYSGLIPVNGTERDLLHQYSFSSNAEGEASDTSTVGILFQCFFAGTRFLLGRPPNNFTLREFYPDLFWSIGGNFGIVDGGRSELTSFAAGENPAGVSFRVDLNPEGDVTGYFECLPSKFWEYKNEAGEAIWDELTLEQLRDPRIDIPVFEQG